jgi:nifR3 family TIM-barrel protein
MSLELFPGFKLSSPYILAPLAGYTDPPFRLIAKKHGASLVFTELISAEGIVRKNPKTLDLMKITDDERPVGIQLFGCKPATMSDAAEITETLKPDLIDINCGCCATKVCSGNSGAALLKTPDIMFSIVSGIVKRVKLPVSVKIRIGWDDKSKNYRDIVSLLHDAGVSFITVHGRTRAQKYGGLANWDIISEIASFSKIPVIGNGDISTFEEAKSRLADSGCTAVMIGRKAIGNPWIFSGEDPSSADKARCALSHFNAMVSFYGEYGYILARKHLVHYFHHFKNAGHIRGSLVIARTPDEVRTILDQFIISVS